MNYTEQSLVAKILKQAIYRFVTLSALFYLVFSLCLYYRIIFINYYSMGPVPEIKTD